MGYIIRNLHKSFGDLIVLKDFNMDIKDSKVISILGPSGCGKTTLLNILSGMIEPEEGEVLGLEGKTISYLFQEPRLLRWKTVEGNIDFILKDKMTYEERQEKIRKYLEMVGLWEYKNYYPDNLSGGMKQRVAIARAFAYTSDILLMDEPFKSLDFELKMNLIHDFIGLWKLDNRTVFFVTHDIQAALMLGDEIHLLSQKPTKIMETIVNSIPHDERSLHNKYILGLAEKLYNHYSEAYRKK
ncbi:ABC transporter ATP-binding protein [Wukongibacter baidiensis]|uniref:ABC transporter ATP-binding protein n=1 Tax=Wukongibacter baidiensis TaxID=1723361 RepID=UPI003D7F3D90